MKKIRAILKLILVIAFIWLAYMVVDTTPYYIEKVHYEKDEIRFIIDDTEKTKSLPDPIIIEDNEVLLSIDTIKKFFDKYIYFDEKYSTIIVAKNEYIYKMPVDSNCITIDGIDKEIDVPVKIENDKVYIPIKELATLYGINVKYNEKVIVDTSSVISYTVMVDDRIHTKKYERELSLTTGRVKKNEEIYIFDDEYKTKSENEYVWVRTQNGSLGYVKKKNINVLEESINEPIIIEEEVIPKINLIWEYAANYTPDRTGEEKKQGIDILSPTWVYVKNTSGDLKENVSTSYLSWAKSKGYDVWPTIKNDDIGIEKTSVLVTDMYKRELLINNILSLCKKYGFKGINLDFENMYKKDKNEFAEFVRELSATLKKNGIKISVDVNVPDGSDNWSLCYDSKQISDVVDYIIVMTYDQYGSSSKKVGPVASLEWVENNIKKMVERDGIDNKKLVLGVPFYSRFWRENNGVVKSTSSLSMAKAEEYMKNNSNNTKWDDTAGQYIVKYTDKNGDVTIYVENEKSLQKKIELAEKYDLAGIAIWRRGFETQAVWKVIK